MREETEILLQPLLDEEVTQTDIIALDSQQATLLRTRRRRRQRWVIIVSVVLVLLLVGGGVLYWQFTQPPPIQFTQATANTGNLSVKISATGPVTANAVYNMNFATTGQVREIDVQAGQHVKQGQVLAKVNVDITALQDSVTQAQLGLTDAQDSLASAENSLGNSQSSLGRTQTSNAAALTLAKDQEQTDLSNCAKTTPPPPANCQQDAQAKFAQAQSQINSSNASADNQITSSQSQVTSAQNNVAKSQLQLQDAQHNLDTANSDGNSGCSGRCNRRCC